MDDTELFNTARYPTPARPLLGMTLLVVEDSRFTSEALRLMCLHSGARIRRADTLIAAERHLKVYCPTVILIDLGLPDGSGLDLIHRLSRHSPRIEVILAISGDDDMEKRSLEQGADGFLAKPILSLASFQETILHHLPAAQRPMDPRLVNEAEITPDPISYHEDLQHAASLLDGRPDERTLDYVAQFLTGLGRSANDGAVRDAGQTLGITRMRRASPDKALLALRGLLQKRLAAAPMF